MTNFVKDKCAVFLTASLSLLSCTMPSVNNDNTKFISCAQIVGIKELNSRKNDLYKNTNKEQRDIKVRIISAESETIFALRNTNKNNTWEFNKIQNGKILQYQQLKFEDLINKFDNVIAMKEESFIENGYISHISCMQIDLNYKGTVKRYSISGIEEDKIPTNIKNLINILHKQKIP